MGGSVATRACAKALLREDKERCIGMIIIDVVEGTAIEA